MANRRIFYACQAVGIAPQNTEDFTVIRGLQSVGINTTFNLEQVFEIGMISIYENIENIPDVEITLEKVLDGYPLIYHLATRNAASATLVGRSAVQANVALSIFDDVNEAASGTPVSTCVVSGCFVSQVSYKVGVDGNATESVTIVANNKEWKASGTWNPNWYPIDYNDGAGTAWDADPYPSGGAYGDGQPAAKSGIARRQHVDMSKSVFPSLIPGMTNVTANLSTNTYRSGVNAYNTGLGCYDVSFQSFSASVNLGREQILELGRKAPYFRYVKFPVEVTSEFEVLSKTGDKVSATEEGVLGFGSNLANESIKVYLTEGTLIDLGQKNKLQSVNYQGGGTDGGNATATYSFQTFNDFVIKHRQDPTTALALTGY